MGTRLRSGAGFALLLLMILASRPGFSAEGVFQGRVVKPPGDGPQAPGWIFVQGNHSLRRVEVAHATIVFQHQGSSRQEQRCGPECLKVGQEIVVTARQDAAGEWRAKRVEILGFASGRLGAPVRSSCSVNNLTKFNVLPGLLDNRSWAAVHPTRHGEIPEDGGNPGL